MSVDATFVILGATGDLARRKLIPALYRLVLDGHVRSFHVALAARRRVAVQEVLGGALPFIGEVESRAWNRLSKNASYHVVDFEKGEGFEDLCSSIAKKKGVRVFYLATLPEHFEKITKSLKQSGSVRPEDRVMFEKPFGHDRSSARKLNSVLHSLFSERQLFRVDHYLGKELVENIVVLRFANKVFGPLWNRNGVESIQVILSETVGMEGRRGSFYDRQGALRDVVQSHMLQLLALVTMDEPASLQGDSLRMAKAAILAKLRVKDVLLGQYEGYIREAGVAKASRTETFAALHLELQHPSWRRVPLLLVTGKCLDKKETAVHISFRRVPCRFASCPEETNAVSIHVQPKPQVVLTLNAKVPGLDGGIAPVPLAFDYEYAFGPNTPVAYETLLLSVLHGRNETFVHAREVDESWRVIDAARRLPARIHHYKKGSSGPLALRVWKRSKQVRWKI
ncbi:glucose-6-phosphate dehydrogenase [Candidatus Woesearchaeota archaeon]|nr:MAG: glucose-6-phosphate dehydrogenase [Candidatus Woesearchaeota archaeon]